MQVEQARSGAFHAPQKQFILESGWDEKLDGKWDATKVVEANVFGKLQKGIWKNVGRAGVYLHDEYDGTTHKEIAIEEDGDGDLVEQAIAAKSEAILAGFALESVQRSANAVEHNPEQALVDLKALLMLIRDQGAVSDQAAGAVPDQAAAETIEPENESDSLSVSDDNAVESRLSGYFATTVTKALPKESSPAKTKIGEASAKNLKTGGPAKAEAAKAQLGGPLPMKLTFSAVESFDKLQLSRPPAPIHPGNDSASPLGDSSGCVMDTMSHRPAASGQANAATGQKSQPLARQTWPLRSKEHWRRRAVWMGVA